MVSRALLQTYNPQELRQEIRHDRYGGETAGFAAGYLQGNLVILPEQYALDFLKFCQRNPKPCPLIAISDTGDFCLPTLGRDIDIRADVPKYILYENGQPVDQPTNIADLWRADLVSFVLGCSFTFEDALQAEGIEVRHIGNNKNVPMYQTNIPAISAGPFSGNIVVSMRPMTAADAIRAVEITSRFPLAHGAPIHLGDPAEIGILDIEQPDWGDPGDFKPNEIPVFWACGVTPQIAIRNAKLPLCVTHAPGHMLITDIHGTETGLRVNGAQH